MQMYYPVYVNLPPSNSGPGDQQVPSDALPAGAAALRAAAAGRRAALLRPAQLRHLGAHLDGGRGGGGGGGRAAPALLGAASRGRAHCGHGSEGAPCEVNAAAAEAAFGRTVQHSEF